MLICTFASANLHSSMYKLGKTLQRLLVWVLFCLISHSGMRAQSINDSITVSLLTCSPGDMVYELYGHTAVLVSVPGRHRPDSVVFNYGVFNFSQPNFIWRFMVGKTDYMLQPVPYGAFKREYTMRGSEIMCQQLNLTQAEAIDIYKSLQQNALPQHSVYRYNFLTDNCTTRARDIIEAGIHGKVRYKEQPKMTYRRSLHEFTTESPWAELGDDILLGAHTDTLLDDRAMQFLPYHLKSYFDAAYICDSMGTPRPLVQKTTCLLAGQDMPAKPGFPLSPLVCSFVFLGVMLLVAVLEFWMRRMWWFLDLLLMPAVGSAGLLVTFMFLISEHPTMDSNWQVWVLNPLPLFCMPWVVWSAVKHRFCVYHYINAVILLSFLVASPWIPQSLSLVMMILVVSLLTRPLSYIYNFSRLKSKPVKSRKKK